jgi:hypothetical protein
MAASQALDPMLGALHESFFKTKKQKQNKKTVLFSICKNGSL